MTIKDYVINAVASAAAIAAGTTLVNNKINDARQDAQIAQLEELQGSVDGLRVDLSRVDRRLAHLDGQLDRKGSDG